MTRSDPQTAREGLRSKLYDIFVDHYGNKLLHENAYLMREDIMQAVDQYVSDEVRQARLSERKEIALDNYHGHTFSGGANWQGKFQKFIENNERRIAQLAAQERTGQGKSK